MYVCICRGVSEKRIRKAVAEGVCTLRDLRTALGVGTGCGKCVSQAYEVLNECRRPAPPKTEIYLARSA